MDKLFTDKASGKDTPRPQLDALLSFAREGDTVVVHSMDRLARNLDDLRRLVQTLTKRGIRIEFVKECLSFTGEDSPMANLLLSVMGAFAEFERGSHGGSIEVESSAEAGTVFTVRLPRAASAATNK